MASILEMYFEIHREMMHVRFMRQGAESIEEDSLLDRLDGVWMRLTDDEREHVNCVASGLPDPAHDSPAHRVSLVDVDVNWRFGDVLREYREVA